MVGEFPGLARGLDRDGNLKHNVDFRSVYASLLEHWFDVDSEPHPSRRQEAAAVQPRLGARDAPAARTRRSSPPPASPLAGAARLRAAPAYLQVVEKEYTLTALPAESARRATTIVQAVNFGMDNHDLVIQRIGEGLEADRASS